MQELVATIPDMWADHHVLRVREVLTRLPGVAGVAASARDLRVAVTFDPGATAEDALVEALVAAGYPPGDGPSPSSGEKDKPAWTRAPRVTTTDATDLAMSGDYRQY